MKLYHYSKSHYDVLKTREKQGQLTEEQKRVSMQKNKDPDQPGFYWEHISFFFDRIPLDIIGSIFGKDHHTWHPGNVLWEYEIDVNKIGEFSYSIVETPEKTDLYYDETISDYEYHRRLKALITEKKYVGYNKHDFLQASREFHNVTREYYKLLKSRPNFDEIKNKYAPTVPHVMLYPKTGIVPYVKSSIVKVR